MLFYSDRDKEIYERTMENVITKVDATKAYLEQLSYELSEAELSEDEQRKMDKILNKAMRSLDGI